MNNYEVKFQTKEGISVSQKAGKYYIGEKYIDINHLRYHNGEWQGIYKNKPFKARRLGSWESHEQHWLINGKKVQLELKTELQLLLEKMGLQDLGQEDNKEILAPMPGLVLKVLVKEGEQIDKDQPLLVLESMKMENVLKASAKAIVQKIHCEIGQTVEKNSVLIDFE